jgi:hypothetical protein
MPKIVISYRREDTEAITGRIRDRLASHFGAQSVFMDIDSIPLGVNFRTYIAEALQHTDLLLAIIGPAWYRDGKDKVRISHPTDPVRIEIEKAFELKIPVWPVLVNNADMPDPSALPPSIQELSDHNAAFVASGRDFHPHMDRLIRQIDRFLGTAPESSHVEKTTVSETHSSPSSTSKAKPRSKISLVVVVASIAAIVMAGTGALFWLLRSTPPPTPSPSIAGARERIEAVPCTEERTLRSLGTATPTSITFVNKSGEAKRVYWLNHSGERVLYFTLPVGQSMRQPTFISHPWVVTNTSDQCQGIYMPAANNREVILL